MSSMPPMMPIPPGPREVLPPPGMVLEGSKPRPRFPLLPVAVVGGAAVAGGLLLGEAPNDAAQAVQRLMALMVPMGVLTLALGWGSYMTRQLRDEARQVEQVENGLRLKQFDAAAWQLAGLLSKPMLLPLNRARALGGYVASLVRFGRFEEAAEAANGLLGEGVPTPMVRELRAAKVFALLREDRLTDADRALSDLRKEGRDGPNGAMLALAEGYRDVRTGHAEDFLLAHAARRRLVARYLGNRVADLDALGAWAALWRNEKGRAQRLWRRASMVANISELMERYPELKDAALVLSPEPVPAEAVVPAGYAVGGWR